MILFNYIKLETRRQVLLVYALALTVNVILKDLKRLDKKKSSLLRRIDTI